MDGDVGKVFEIEEGLGYVSRGDGDQAVDHRVAEEVLAEVLGEHAGANDSRRDPGGPDGFLGVSGTVLASPGQQHQSPHPAATCPLSQRAERLQGVGVADVRGIGDVRPRAAV